MLEISKCLAAGASGKDIERFWEEIAYLNIWSLCARLQPVSYWRLPLNHARRRLTISKVYNAIVSVRNSTVPTVLRNREHWDALVATVTWEPIDTQEFCELAKQIHKSITDTQSLVRQALNGLNRVLVAAAPLDAPHPWDADAADDMDWKAISQERCFEVLQKRLNEAIVPGTARAVETAHLATITKEIVDFTTRHCARHAVKQVARSRAVIDAAKAELVGLEGSADNLGTEEDDASDGD